MLAKRYILRGEENFQRVQKEGRLFQSDSFGIAVFDRGDSEYSRFGFVVSAKISKLSVQRNRIRRALSEAVRYMVTRTKLGFDVVFLAKEISAKKTTEELMHEVKFALSKAGLLK